MCLPTMKASSLLASLSLLVLLGAGCSASSSTSRPEAETTLVEDANDFSGVVDGDYYTPLREGEEPVALPGVRYVRVGDYTGPSVAGGQAAVRRALGETLSGFTCPVRGRVFVMAMISATGEALAPRVNGSINPECDARALAVFSRLRFVPAQVGGGAVAMPLTIPVTFQ